MTPIVTGEKCFTDPQRTKLGADRIAGDLNRNCILDPGDLILMFSDGVDDDANGYTDDICGWDFFKNDNDAYDDTRYGHGTGEGHGAAIRRVEDPPLLPPELPPRHWSRSAARPSRR